MGDNLGDNLVAHVTETNRPEVNPRGGRFLLGQKDQKSTLKSPGHGRTSEIVENSI